MAGNNSNRGQSSDDASMKALTVALEMLRKGLADLPIANLTTALDRWDGAGEQRAQLNTVQQSRQSQPSQPINFADEWRKQQITAIRQKQRAASEDAEIAAANKGPGAKIAERIGSTFSTVMNGFVGKFVAVLGPMALLSQVVTSNASGFQVLGSAVKLLAATIGPILFPVIAVLAAALIELSDTVWQDIQPALETFYGIVVSTLLPAVRSLIDAFMEVVNWVGRQILGDGDAKRRKAVEEGREAGMTEAEIRAQARAANWSEKEIEKAITDANKANWSGGAGGSIGGGGGAGEGGGGAGKKTGVDGMQIVMQEMRRSMGPQAQITGLAAASRNAQLAALNSSPIEKMMLERLTKMLETMERVAVNTGDIAKKPSAVDF